jgi:hypothetical protein
VAFARSHAIESTEKSRIVAEARKNAIARVRARQEATIRQARTDCATFIEYVMRNEADGAVLRNAPFHREWQATLEENSHVVLIAPVEHAKSQQVSVGRVLFELGRNPGIRIALISCTSKLAEKLLKQVRAEIERNPRLSEVFPHLRKSSRSEDPWKADAITIERSTTARDPSVQALGAFGAIVGSRLDLIILDDVLDFDNTRTEEQRKKLLDWFDTTVYTRAVASARVYCIGTPWHPDDLLHELSKRPAFAVRRYSAVENPDDPPRQWRPIWPEQWSLKRLQHRRANMPEAHFIRKYLCQVRLDATSRFKERWFNEMSALGKGRTFELVAPPRRSLRGPFLPCFTGVDLAVGDKTGSARTVIFTMALMPDWRRLIVNIESGQWQAPEILERLERTYQAYKSDILVESNGAQKYIVQLSAGRIPVRGLHTGAGNKFHEQWGVESLAVEMRQKMWIMPSGVSGVDVPEDGVALKNECLHYDPALHVGDRLMAMWLARECARQWGTPRGRRLDTQRR